MNALVPLLILPVLVFTLSYALGLLYGGHAVGDRVVAWELRTLLRIGRWVLWHVIAIVAGVCVWGYRKL